MNQTKPRGYTTNKVNTAIFEKATLWEGEHFESKVNFKDFFFENCISLVHLFDVFLLAMQWYFNEKYFLLGILKIFTNFYTIIWVRPYESLRGAGGQPNLRFWSSSEP